MNGHVKWPQQWERANSMTTFRDGKSVEERRSYAAYKKDGANAPQPSREELEQEVEQFLSSGGRIRQIPEGVSGVVDTKGPRHITLSRSQD